MGLEGYFISWNEEMVNLYRTCLNFFENLILKFSNFYSEHELSNFITYGGLDALVYLCRVLHTYDLHQLGTTALANLSGYGKLKLFFSRFFLKKLIHF